MLELFHFEDCPYCLKVRRKLELHIPDTIADRYLVAFPAEGNAGPEGAPAGDLLITLRIK